MNEQKNMEITKSIHMSVSPHDRYAETTSSIMRDVLIALTPATIMGVYTFGWRAFVITVLSILSCVLTEYVFQKCMKQQVTISDLSAAVTGMILAVNLPSTVPFWIPVLGGVFAILVVKQLFGGLGFNIMNPALAARCFLLISFAAIMTQFPETIRTIFTSKIDTVGGATPLAFIKEYTDVNWFDMIFNTHNGCIGEASPIAVLIGAAYLLIRRTITIHIPGVYVLSTILFVVLFQLIGGNASQLTLNYLIAQVCGGGLLIGAFFMADDYVTCPITFWGQIIYACVLGLLTAVFRVLGSTSEGVSNAIIIGNLLVPLIERVTIPHPFGLEKKGGATK